jgi:hypothetical protein
MFLIKRSSTLWVVFSVSDIPPVILSQAAIGEQLDGGYVAAVVGGQKQDGLRDFISGAGTATRPGVSVCAS